MIVSSVGYFSTHCGVGAVNVEEDEEDEDEDDALPAAAVAVWEGDDDECVDGRLVSPALAESGLCWLSRWYRGDREYRLCRPRGLTLRRLRAGASHLPRL